MSLSELNYDRFVDLISTMDIRQIIKLSRVNKKFNEFVNAPETWLYLLNRDFPDNPLTYEEHDLKKAYVYRDTNNEIKYIMNMLRSGLDLSENADYFKDLLLRNIKFLYESTN